MKTGSVPLPLIDTGLNIVVCANSSAITHAHMLGAGLCARLFVLNTVDSVTPIKGRGPLCTFLIPHSVPICFPLLPP